MRIVTPYGRSFTRSVNENRSIRRLRLKARRNENKGTRIEVNIPQFLESDPRAIMAAWISMIDKIYRKPKKGKRPSKAQFDARDALGKACWRLMVSKSAIEQLDKEKKDFFGKIWESKLHPYPYKKNNGHYNFDDKEGGKGPDGSRFNETPWAPHFRTGSREGTNPEKTAELIDQYLHVKQEAARQHSRKTYKQGLIAARAKSVEQNTLANHMVQSVGSAGKKKSELLQRLENLVGRKGLWSRDLQEQFKAYGDVAAAISGKTKELEKPHDAFKRKRISARDAVKIISDQYGKQFAKRDAQGKETCKTRREIEADGQGDLLALYDVVRAYYKKHLNRSQKNGKTRPFGLSLPKNNDELFSLLYNQELNRVTNDLIRLGRVLHYESSATDQDGFEEIWMENPNIPQERSVKERFLPESLEHYLASPYWESAGQADIKRTEAFVRVWRNGISQASRSLLNWTDPKHKRRAKGDEDPLARENILLLKTDPNFDQSHARAQLKILFGRDANLFTEGQESETDQSLIDHCFLALLLARVARTEIVHFRGRRSFVERLKSLGDPKSGDTKQDDFKGYSFEKVEMLFSNDETSRRKRIVHVCEGAQLHRFGTPDQVRSLVEAMLSGRASELVLPHFNKLLKGLHNLEENRLQQKEEKQGVSYISNDLLTLPDPAKERELETPWKLAKFIGSRLVYERLFRPWLEDQEASKINAWIEKAQQAATERARSTVQDNDAHAMIEIIESQAASVLALEPEQKLTDLFEDLAHETAAAMRVQKYYDSDPEQARKQMKWIEDFKYHIVGQAFLAFLSEKSVGSEFAWILGVGEKTPYDKEAEMPKAEGFAVNALEIEAWQSKLYFLLHMMPVDDVSQLLHQFRKWTVLEAKGDSSVEAKQSPLPTSDGGVEDVLRIISVFTLYLDMADAKYVWQKETDQQDTPDIGLEAARGFYENTDDFKQIFPSQENEEEHRLAATRRGIRQIMRFGHMDLLCQNLKKNKIPTIEVTALVRAEAFEDDGITAWHEERDALHDKAVKASRKRETVTDFTKEDFDRYKTLVTWIANYRFLSENVRLNTHIRYHRLLVKLMSRLVDYAGLWERDRYFMTLALLKLHGQTPYSALGKDDGRHFAKEGKIPHEIGGGGDAFQRACELVNVAPNPKTPQSKKALFKRVRSHRNNLAHFKSLTAGKTDINFTDLVNETREMMNYDRKLKNAVSKSIVEILEREGFHLKWSIREGQHNLGSATVESRRISHLKAWRAAEKDRQKQEDKIRLNEQYAKDRSGCAKAKFKASQCRNTAFETGAFSCNEDLKSDLLVEAVAQLFGGTKASKEERQR